MSTFSIYRGNSRRFDHIVERNGVVENLTGATIYFTAKAKVTDPYSSAIIKKSTGALGGVVITDAAQGEVSTFILPADTVGLTKRTTLEYDLELQTVLGDVETIERGSIIVDVDITDTTSPAGPAPPVAPAPTDGTFVQWQTSLTPDAYAASLWTLPVTAPVLGDVGKLLSVTAAGVTGFVSGLTAPANPADNARFARALDGNLEYIVAKESYLLSWAANGPGTGSGSTNYLNAGGGNLATGAIGAVPSAIVMLDDGTLDILQVIHGAPAALATLTYTIEVNEVATALTLALSSSSSQGSNIVNVINVLRGDRVRCTVTNPGSSNSTIRLGVFCRFRRTLGT